MKRGFLFGVLIILISLTFVNATINVPVNYTGEVQTSYDSGSFIKGWLNLSLDRESNDSLITTFFNNTAGKTFKIRDLLNLNGLSPGYGGYSCIPSGCGSNLVIGSESSSQRFTIGNGESKLVGIKIIGDEPINSIELIEFDVSSTSGDSCSKPLKMDILDEGTYEYSAQNLSSSFCAIEKPQGCFNPGLSSTQINETSLEDGNNYCEKIEIPPYLSYLVGANISGNSNTWNEDIEISMEVNGITKICRMETESVKIVNNKIMCNITLDNELTSFTNATICINPKAPNPYKIRYEIVSPVCGELIYGDTPSFKDFEIFAYPIKYRAPGNFRFNQSFFSKPGDFDGVQGMKDLASTITSGLGEMYNYQIGGGINCTTGCIIPIKFLSGSNNQNITISNVILSYRHGGIPLNTTSVGTVTLNQPLLSLRNPTKLNLDGLNIITPSSSGIYKFAIKSGDTELFKTNISISEGTAITDIIPHYGVALVNNSFFAVFDNPNNQTAAYMWYFSNSIPILTYGPSVTYKFPNTGVVSVTLQMLTNKGNSSKTITLNVVTPDVGFNETVLRYKEYLSAFSSQIGNSSYGVSSFAKQEIDGKLKTNDLLLEINQKSSSYWNYLNSEETQRLKIMSEILAMKVPKVLETSQYIKNSKFLQDPSKISFEKLDEFEAGSLGENVDEEDVKKQINSWINQNLDVNVESKSYKVGYSTGEKSFLVTDMVFTLTPKENLDELYLVIDSPALADKIKVANSELKTRESTTNDAFLIDLKDLVKDTSVRVQFLYPAEVTINSLPVYITPDLKKVGGNMGLNVGVCNNNDVCGDGENYKNCPGDCKPWGLAIILIIILIIIAFIIYVIMQEWYKRHYESYLFTNKIQLYNLINFMYTSSNQGTNKPEIFSKLKSQGWTAEQLDYAWKKFKGQRIGMWEIPVFKWVENKQVKTELIKRNPGMNKNTVIR